MAVVWDICHSAQVPRFSNQARNKDLNIQQLETLCVCMCERVRARMCVCVYVHARVHACVHVCALHA